MDKDLNYTTEGEIECIIEKEIENAQKQGITNQTNTLKTASNITKKLGKRCENSYPYNCSIKSVLEKLQSDTTFKQEVVEQLIEWIDGRLSNENLLSF